MTLAARWIGVTKRYGSFGSAEALSSFSLEVNEGEILGIAGPNGAGKTTALKILLGLAVPSSGRATISHPAGFLPEEPALPLDLSARDILATHMAALGRGKSGEEIEKTLALVGLETAGGKRVGHYSKGMRRRLALGVALVGEPAVLVLDEPQAGLDPAGRIEMERLITDFGSRGGTVIIASHDLALLGKTPRRLAVLDSGRLAEVRPISGPDEAEDLFWDSVGKKG